MSSALHTTDANLALERAGGNRELARELYQMLQNDLPNYRATIQRHFDSGDYDALLEVVHKLGGSATYCGVPAMKEAAKRLETSLKKGEESQYAVGTTELVDEIERLLQTPEMGI